MELESAMDFVIRNVLRSDLIDWTSTNVIAEVEKRDTAQRDAGRREIEEAACLRGQHVARRPGGCACGHMPPFDLDDDPAPGPVVTSNFEATAPPLSPREQADIISSLVYQLAGAPEPGVEPGRCNGSVRIEGAGREIARHSRCWLVRGHAGGHIPKPEQPSSLVGQAKLDLDGMGVTADSILRLVFMRHAEAIDALTARTESHVHDVLRGDVDALTAGSRLVSAVVDGLAANVEELKAWAEEHPAAPEPGD